MADADAPRRYAARVEGAPVERAYGVTGQIVNAGTNVATSYVASLLLVPADFGRFVIAFGCVTVVLGAGRGLLGASMLVHLPARDPGERDALIRSALGFALGVGLAAAAVLGATGLWAPVLWWFAPWVVVALLQDVGRYVYLSTGRAGRALALDVVWAGLQAAVVVIGFLATSSITVGLLATAWGLGALGGLLTFVALDRVPPARPSRWTRATRDVAGWFTAAAVIGQVELYLVLLLAGLLLAPADVGGLRAIQLMSLQPALVVLGSMLTVLQPAVVRASAEVGGLRRVWPRITLALTPVIGGLVLVALLRDPLVRTFFPQYLGYAHLVVPVAIQSAAVALSVAPIAVLNGLRRGSTAFSIQACRLVAMVVAVVAGAGVAGLTGAAWALASAAVLTCLHIRSVGRGAVSRHETRTADPCEVAEAAAGGAR